MKHEQHGSDRLLSLATPVSRRTVVKTGAAAAGAALTMPYFFSRASAATSLKFWQFYAPGGGVKSQTQWWQDMAKAWNDKNETKVELVFVPGSDYISGSKLQTAFASGNGPDIFIISPGDFLRYYNGGVLVELSQYMDKAAIDDFYPDVIATRAVDGKIYGLPMEVEPMCMYYSVDAWQKAGLTDKDIPTTWDALIETGQKLHKGNQFGIYFETGPGYYQNFTWYPFLWMTGNDMVNKDGKTSGMSSDGATAALKLWQDTIKNGSAPRKGLGGGGGDVVANLGAKYCAMQNLGIWGVSAMEQNDPKFKYDVFKLPVPPGGKYGTIAGGWAFVANAKGKDPETAAKFCVWALGSMEADSVQRVADWCTKAKSDMPPRKSVLSNAAAAEVYNTGMMKKFKDEIFPGARGEPRVPPEVYKAVSDAIQSTQLSGADPKQAGATAAQQIEKFLSTYNGASII